MSGVKGKGGKKGCSGGHNRTPLVWNGKTYESRSEMAMENDVDPQVIYYYLKLDKPFKGHFIDYAIEINNK